MSRRIIKIERNNISLSKDDKRSTKSGTDYNYASRQSEDSTTEDEVEFEGWIEFVSKKDTKTNTDRNSLSTKRESRSRDASRRSTSSKALNSKGGITSQRNTEYSYGNSKRSTKDKEGDNAKFKGDLKSKKSSTVHAQIHAQVQKYAPPSTHNPTSTPLQSSSLNQAHASTQMQAPSQTHAQMPLQTAIPSLNPNETQATVSIPSAMQTVTPTQAHVEVPTQATPSIQYVQAQPVAAAPNTALQPGQQHMVHVVPTPLSQMQVQQQAQPLQPIQQQVQQQLQQILQSTSIPTPTPQIQVQHMQPPIQQQIQPIVHQVQQQMQPTVHQVQQPMQSTVQQVQQHMQPTVQQVQQHMQPTVHQVQQPMQPTVHQIQQPMQSTVQQVHQHMQPTVHQVQQPMQSTVHQVQQQIQQPTAPQIQVVNGHMMPNFRSSNGTDSILMDGMASTLVNSEQNCPPVYIRQPPTVVVASKPGPPIIINPPPANVIFENQPPQPIYVNNPKPNIIMKNETTSLNPNSGIDTLTMSASGGALSIDNLPPPVFLQPRGGAGVVARASLIPNGNATVIDNKNIYLTQKNANDTATIVHNDFMQTGHGFDPRSAHSASTVFIPNIGHTQHIPYPKHVHMPAQPHSSLSRLCSCLDPSTSYSNESNAVAGNIIDMGFLSNVQHMCYPKDIRLSHPHQCRPPTIVPMGSNNPFAHMPQQPQIIYMDPMGQSQIMQAQESNPHVIYEPSFLPQMNEAMMSNAAMQFPIPMSTMQPMYMAPQAQATPHMMSTGNGCTTPVTVMPEFRSPNLQLQPNNIQRMNSIPPGCTLSNMGCSGRNSCINRSKIGNNKPKKIEITAKPMGMRAATNPIYR